MVANQNLEKQPRKPEYLAVGHVLGPWGVRGETKIQVMTDFPESLDSQREVYLNGQPLIIEKSRLHKGHRILKLSTIDNIEAAERLQGQRLEIPLSKAHVLPQGEYYQHQLIGLEVLSTEGEFVGRIAKILPTGSNDVYLISGHCGEVPIPATNEVVKSIDLESGQMIIEIIDGLLE